MSEQYKKLEELSKDYLSKIYKDKTVIRVQTGTSGQAVGADEILKLLLSSEFSKYRFELFSFSINLNACSKRCICSE